MRKKKWIPAYQPGDRVRVRADLKTDWYYCDETGGENVCGCVGAMLEWAGKVVTIKSIDRNDQCYKIEEDGWNWVYGEIEGLANVNGDQQFKIGDRVVGNKRADEEYCITVEGWEGVVVGFEGKRIIVEGQDDRGNKEEFDVLPECFDLLVTAEQEKERWQPEDEAESPFDPEAPFKEPWEELF